MRFSYLIIVVVVFISFRVVAKPSPLLTFSRVNARELRAS